MKNISKLTILIILIIININLILPQNYYPEYTSNNQYNNPYYNPYSTNQYYNQYNDPYYTSNNQYNNPYYNPYSTNQYYNQYNNPYQNPSNQYSKPINPNYNTFSSNQYYNPSSQYNDPYYSRYNNQNTNNYFNRYDYGDNIYGNSINPQLYPPGYSGFQYNSPNLLFNDYGNQQCIGNQDLILQIAPGGCRPSVIRSDLLEEQNIPVFCKVMAIQVNPLIDLTRVRSLRFTGELPAGISGVSYYPARSALTGVNIAGNSVFNDNLGYLVVVVSRQNSEAEMPDYLEGNITAVIDYLSEGAFGIGETNFYLSELSESEWISNYRDYGFWNGRGYVRIDNIDSNRATISIYNDLNSRQSTFTLGEGQTSGNIFLSGYYCAAGLRVRLDDINFPRDSALLQINDEQIWVAKGDLILNNRCRVTDLEAFSGGGSVSLNCPGNQIIKLNLNPGKAVFSYQGRDFNEKAIGENIIDDIYLGYIGQDIENNRYAIIVKDGFSNSDRSFREKNLYNTLHNLANDRLTIEEINNNLLSTVKKHYTDLSFDNQEVNTKVDAKIIKSGDSELGIRLNNVLLAKNKDLNFDLLTAQQVLAKKYYDLSLNDYNNVIELYPIEKMEFIEDDPYAAKSLLEIAVLSRTLGFDETAYNYYTKLINEYPNSNSASEALRDQKNLLKYDTSNSQASVNLFNENFLINVLDFKKPSINELSVSLLIDGEEKNIGLNQVLTLRKANSTHNFKITNINDDYFDLEYENRDNNPIIIRKRLSLAKNQDNFNGLDVRLLKINLNNQAKITILASGYGPRAQSNFKFKIGIEKRLIQLSPERAKELKENLEKSIENWNKINEQIGNVVRGLKGACFATSAILSAKSVLSGDTSKLISRGLLMVNNGGWNEKCERLVEKGEYASVQQCLLANADKIENDVNTYSNNIISTDNIIRDLEKQHTTNEGIFGIDRNVNTGEVEKDFKSIFESWCVSQSGSIKLPGKENQEVLLENSDKSICKWETLTHSQRREIMNLYNTKNIGGSDVLRNVIDNELGRVMLDAKNFNDEHNDRILSDKIANQLNLGIKTTDPAGDSITNGFIKTITLDDTNNVYKNFNKGEKVVRVFIPSEKNIGGNSIFKIQDEAIAREIAGKQVIVEVEFSKNDNYHIPKQNGKVYLVDGTIVSPAAAKEVRRYMSLSGLDKIRQSDKNAYQNKILNPERLRVKYFTKSPYKGLPSEIPFDVENGWYVEMTYVLTGFGRPYDESGRVINFYICNVGENGLIEFKQNSDDICRYYNTINPDVSFPGLSPQDSIQLVNKARRAISDAARQFGKERITINNHGFDSGISFGGEEGRCTDFMSVHDCTLMFNVCDPVICPASRCDYGGQYRVDNVIQSGIAGSLLLCLPNYKEGIVAPICLSGVHAGLDGYISILNSTARCLDESIETGRNVGICDEIKSIYLCEFFWNQAAPLTEVIIPNLFSGIHGGGEYLTTQDSYQNTQNAISYFTQVYASNSLTAFSNRRLEYAGTEFGSGICKSFVSLNFGGVADLFSTLIEPDSPVQYSAWFSEFPLSTATLPPTSHYKVYYHIFAGKDIGAFYSVYLKDLPQLGLVNILGVRVISQGYIERGSQVDEAVDIILPSGFKQLCISVNGREECGFGQVSTSYAINSLTESFLSKQLTENIVSEKQCIAGSPNPGSLLNPNIQAGVEEYINPQLYNNGIIRVCSTNNPGLELLPGGSYDKTNLTINKWQEVGYCDDPSIKCWMDTDSVKQIIRDKKLEQQVLDTININSIGEENFYTYEKSRSIADNAEDYIESISIDKQDTEETIHQKTRDVVNDLRKLTRLGIINVHRARAHYLLGRLYKKITEELWKGKENEGNIITYKDYTYNNDLGNIDNTIENTNNNLLPVPDENPVNKLDASNLINSGYYLDKGSRIYDSNKEYTGFYIDGNQKYPDGRTRYLIYESKKFLGLFGNDNLVGEIINGKLLFNVDTLDITTQIRELNGLYANFENNRLYKEKLNNPSLNEKDIIYYLEDKRINDINGIYTGYYFESEYNQAEQKSVHYLFKSGGFVMGRVENKQIVLTVDKSKLDNMAMNLDKLFVNFDENIIYK